MKSAIQMMDYKSPAVLFIQYLLLMKVFKLHVIGMYSGLQKTGDLVNLPYKPGISD